MDRVVGHIDLDYFYAQVEEVEDPTLKVRPVIVCVFSGRTEDSGVVSTANYKAREFGVHSGMPIAQAKKKLEGSNPAVIRMEHEKYETISDRIMGSMEQMVDVLEPTGIDEAFFDLTPSTGGNYDEAKKAAETIKETILKDEHLTCSVGLGRSKVISKLGSDSAKPGGLAVITPENTTPFLRPLPASRLYGVGPKTATLLEKMKIKTIGNLADADPIKLEERFGKKFGSYLHAAATGTDSDPVIAGLEPTQFSRIITLKKDTRDPKEALDQLAEGIRFINEKLVSSRKSFKTLTAIAILTDFSTKTRSKSFETPVNNSAVIQANSSLLFEDLSKSVGMDFRRVGLRVSGLQGDEDQTSLSEFFRPSK